MLTADFGILDQLSISQENFETFDHADTEICLSEVLKPLPPTIYCTNNAPYICFVDNVGKARLVQGCCNSWTCPRCGNLRAKQEYGRMVQGAKMLEKDGKKLYAHTWTCRGLELSLAEAEENYGKWTNAMLQSCRDRTRQQKEEWTYVQVTERQKRAHPHSHIITSFLPSDARLVTVKKWDKSGQMVDRQIYRSAWYEKRLKSANLGDQYDITEIRELTGCVVYFAKYLFKDAMFTFWPNKWKRVRYAQSWPKHPDRNPPEVAFAIVRRADWSKVDQLGMRVYADTLDTLEVARHFGQFSVTYKEPVSVNLGDKS